MILTKVKSKIKVESKEDSFKTIATKLSENHFHYQERGHQKTEILLDEIQESVTVVKSGLVNTQVLHQVGNKQEVNVVVKQFGEDFILPQEIMTVNLEITKEYIAIDFLVNGEEEKLKITKE